MLYLVPRPHVAGLGTRFAFTAVLLNFCTLTFVNCRANARACTEECGRICKTACYKTLEAREMRLFMLELANYTWKIA